MRRPVAITGIGAITPVGTGREALWDGVRKGKSAVTAIERFDVSQFNSRVAAQVDFDPSEYLTPQQCRRLDRFSQFALVAARLAMEDSGLTANEMVASNAGSYMGSALGGVAFGEEQHSAYVTGGPRTVNPLLALSVFGGAATSNISIEHGLTGPSLAFGNSCAAGVIAIGEAARLIADGRAHVMLAGGAEAPLAPLTFGAFSLIRVLSTRNDDPETASRPFDSGRDGFVMAEGAAVLTLESFEHATARGATIYALVSGYATTNDAHHMTAPRPDAVQASRALSGAIADACLPPSAIDYVNAHGSSTVLNDAAECRAVRLSLDRHADRISMSGTKGLHGHALGATGAIETAICAMSLREGWIPGTANLQDIDPECDLDIIGPQGRAAQVEHIATNAFGFGGVNASLILSAAS
ncbi:beta-ketoacyl-ACP synthase II [soil metagenome]